MYRNPYQDYDGASEYQRANFHTHAGTGPNTCGSIPIEEVLAEYQRLGYGAICISNHNLYTDPAPYRDKFELCLPDGYEYTVGLTHIVCVGTKKVQLESPQAAIDSAAADGGFSILCHPNWQRDWSLSKETLDSVHGFMGIEIYNGSIDCGAVRSADDSNGRCNAPEAYDYLLSNGRLCWCFGNDDFHRWNFFTVTWNMIYSARSYRDIAEAVRKGAFYVSTGLFLEYMTLQDNRIQLKVRNSEGYRDTYRYRFIGQNGTILKETLAGDAFYDLRGDELYVRVEVMGSSGKMLYTQPVYDNSKLVLEAAL